MNSNPLQKYQNRPYKCPCGKFYLSYAALFTHVKQKHDGQPPGSIIKPEFMPKRGRPRREGEEDSQSRREMNRTPARKNGGQRDNDRELEELLNQEDRWRDVLPSKVFVPPISDAQLDQLKNLPNKNFNTEAKYNRVKSMQEIKVLIKEGFQVLNCQKKFSSLPLIESMIQRNEKYMQCLRQQRNTKRSQMEVYRWQMEVIPAILEFLDWNKYFLTYLQFKNLEVVISLLITYLKEKVQDVSLINTNNYVDFLNDFVEKHIKSITAADQFKRIYMLQGDSPLLIVSIFHKWLIVEGLTNCQLQINPNYENQPLQLHIFPNKQENDDRSNESYSENENENESQGVPSSSFQQEKVSQIKEKSQQKSI